MSMVRQVSCSRPPRSCPEQAYHCAISILRTLLGFVHKHVNESKSNVSVRARAWAHTGVCYYCQSPPGPLSSGEYVDYHGYPWIFHGHPSIIHRCACFAHTSLNYLSVKRQWRVMQCQFRIHGFSIDASWLARRGIVSGWTSTTRSHAQTTRRFICAASCACPGWHKPWWMLVRHWRGGRQIWCNHLAGPYLAASNGENRGT